MQPLTERLSDLADLATTMETQCLIREAAARIKELEAEVEELQEWRTSLHGSLVDAEERHAARIAFLELENQELSQALYAARVKLGKL